MFTRIQQLVTAPVFEEDREKTAQASLLNDIFLGAAVVIVVLNLLMLIVHAEPLPHLAAVNLWIPLILGGLYLLRQGRVNLAGLAFAGATWLVITLVILVSGGVQTAGFASYIAVILMAGLVYGPRAGVTFAGLSILTGVGFLYAEFDGRLPPPLLPNSSVTMWAGLSVNFANAVALIHLATRRTRQALALAQQNETELQAAMETLQQREKDSSALFTNAHDAIIMVSTETATGVFSNRQFAALTGYGPDETSRLTLKDLIRPDEYDTIIDRYRRRLAGETVRSRYETSIVHKDGRDVPVEVSAAKVDWQGEPAVIVMLRDVTARKQAEAARERAEKRYRQLFEEAPAMYVITRNQAGAPVIADCNNLFLSTLNYERAEVAGRPLADFYDPESRAALLEQGGYRRALTGRFEAEERQLIARDGRTVTTILRASPEVDADGQVTGTRAMFIDITERQRIEAALRTSEALYRSFVESFDGIAFRGDLNFKPIFFHGAVEEMTGYTPNAFVTGPLTWDQLILADDWSLIEEQVRKLTTIPGYRCGREYRIVRKDGQARWIHENIQNVCDESGRPVYVQGAMFDITERKEAEAELDRHRRRLEELVGERTAALVAVNKELEQEISERKEIEEALRESQEKYRTIVENTQDIIYASDPNGLITFVSPTISRLGYSPQDVLGHRLTEFVHREDGSDGAPHTLKTLSTGEGVASTFRLGADRGNLFYVEEISRAVLDEEGQTWQVIGVMRDVTGRKAAEERIRYLANLLENVSDAIISTDLAFNIKSWNRAAETMYGWSSAEAIGQSLTELTAIRYAGRQPEEVANELFAQGHWQGEAIQTRKGGPELQVYASVSLVRDDAGAPVGVVAINQDITGRKRAEEAVRESEERFRRTFDQSPIGAAMVSLDYHFLRVNEQLCRITGYSEADLLALSFPDITHPDDLAADMEQIRRLEAGEIDQYAMDKRYLRQDGRPVWVHLSVRLIRDAAGQPLYYLPMIEDITERRQAEADLEQRNRELILFNRTGQLFNSSLELDQVLGTILEELEHLLGVTAASFWLVVPESGELVCRQATGPGCEEVLGWRLSPGQGLAGRVAQTGQSLIVSDTAADERHFKGVDQKIGLPIRSILSLPMRVKNEVMGVLNLVDTAVGRFNEEDLTLLEPLVASAAIAVQNARLHAAVQAELAERTRAERALRELNETLEQRVEARTRALRKSEERYRNLVNMAPVTIGIHSEGKLVYVNPAGCRLIGAEAPEQLIGRPVQDFVHPDRWQETKKRMARLLQGEGAPYPIEDLYVRLDGTVVPVEVTAVPLAYQEKPAIQFIARDITERQRMEEAMHRRIRDLTILNEANQTINTTDLTERLDGIADAIVQLLDAEVALVILRDPPREAFYVAGASGSDTASIRGRQLPEAGKVAARVITQGESLLLPDVTQDVPLYDGFVREFSITTQGLLAAPLPVKEQTVGAIVALNKKSGAFNQDDLGLLRLLATPLAVAIENVRLFKAEQSRYRETEALRRAALYLTSTMELDSLLNRILTELKEVIPYDSASIQILKDDHLEIISGQGFDDPADVLGTRVPLDENFSPDYRVISSLKPVVIADTRNDPLKLALITGATSRIRSWLGVPLLVRDRAIGMITLDKYQPNFYTGTHAALAQAYAAQAAVAMENARLYRDVQQQMEALQAAQTRLIQNERMAALGRLMASIAHEINNPLQGVQGFLNLLNEELTRRRRQEKIELYLTVAEQEIDRIANIVHRMREFYRPGSYDPESGPVMLDSFYHLAETDLQEIGVHDIMESVLQLANKKLQHSKITVERVWAEQLPPIQASPDHLKQVFLNLTLNAIDAMAEEGGVLRIVTALAADEARQPLVRIEFSDTGVGIAPEILPRLFEPLFSTKAHGSGFGLFTSYQIAAAHHGQITATSQVGAGTTFTILLPVEQPRAGSPAPVT